MERYIYIFTNQFVLLQAHHRPSTSKSTFSNCDSGMTQTSPIAPVSSPSPPPQVTSPLIVSAVCWLVDSSQRDPSLRIVWSLPDQSSPGSSTKRGTRLYKHPLQLFHRDPGVKDPPSKGLEVHSLDEKFLCTQDREAHE